jgi:hypothetical protein
MNGNVPVRFLGEDALVTTHPYPTLLSGTNGLKTGTRQSGITHAKLEKEQFSQERLTPLTCTLNGRPLESPEVVDQEDDCNDLDGPKFRRKSRNVVPIRERCLSFR